MIITLLGKELHFTAAEYGILSYLMKKEGGVVSREDLIYNIEALMKRQPIKVSMLSSDAFAKSWVKTLKSLPISMRLEVLAISFYND